MIPIGSACLVSSIMNMEKSIDSQAYWEALFCLFSRFISMVFYQGGLLVRGFRGRGETENRLQLPSSLLPSKLQQTL